MIQSKGGRNLLVQHAARPVKPSQNQRGFHVWLLVPHQRSGTVPVPRVFWLYVQGGAETKPLNRESLELLAYMGTLPSKGHSQIINIFILFKNFTFGYF
jgi:hypothetical protein